MDVVASVSVFAWIQRVIWPSISIHESDDDIALVVEQAHHLDSSLIAAFQFESPQAVTWGSPRLVSAVKSNAATLGRSLRFDESANLRRLSQHALTLIGVLTLLVASNFAWPAHAHAFWNRLCLGSEQYPTRTKFVTMKLNDAAIPLGLTDPLPHIRVPFGQSLTVEMTAEGEIPTSGFVAVSNLQHEVLTRVTLTPASKLAAQFRGDLTQLVEPVYVTVQLGDAISRPVPIDVVPLPFVDVDWDIQRPRYAATSGSEDSSEHGTRQRFVLEGSAVQLKLTCSNKQLSSARLTANGTLYELTPTAPDTSRLTSWQLPAGTPFQSLGESIKYEVEVTDQDGLSLERPIVGQLRLIADRAPRITVSAVTRKILPTARPKIDYVATDDFGISAIQATLEVARSDGTQSRYELPDPTPLTSEPVPAERHGQYAVSLAEYALQKGDTVQVVLHANDWRGDQPGQRADSALITFSVVDLVEILQESGEEDKKSAKQLDEILKREQSQRTEKN